ncbi:MAG: LuxR C-terminal-related transcriptional regulator [Flavobacteriales bacterium]
MRIAKQSAIMKTIGKLSDRFFPVHERHFDFSNAEYIRQFKNEVGNSIFKKLPESVLVYDLMKSKLEYISPNYEQITGQPASEILKKGPDSLVELIHPDHAEIYNKEVLPSMFRQYSAHCLAANPKDIRFMCTFKVKGPEGKNIWLMNNLCVAETAMKKIPRIVLVFATDITSFVQDEMLTFSTYKRGKNQRFEASKVKRYLSLQKSTSFTRKELSILYLITKGYSTKQISEEMFISPRTVYFHRKSLLKKSNSLNVHQLIQFAANNGLN